MNKEPLLTIIVPTYNRYESAFETTRLLLDNFPQDDIQILVQDCSDTDELGNRLMGFENKENLIYRKVAPCSMTDNWNSAIPFAKGRFISILGDDDAVNPILYAIAKKADKEGWNAFAFSRGVKYFWQDFPASDKAQKMFLGGVFSGNVDCKNTGEKLENILRNPITDSFAHVPTIYDGLLRKEVMERVKKTTGAYFHGVTPDVCLSLILLCIEKTYVVVDWPVFLSGSCANSNGGRAILNKLATVEHLSKYKKGFSAAIPEGYKGVDAMMFDSIVYVIKLFNNDIKTVFGEKFYARVHLTRYGLKNFVKVLRAISGYKSLGGKISYRLMFGELKSALLNKFKQKGFRDGYSSEQFVENIQLGIKIIEKEFADSFARLKFNLVR